MLREDHSQLLCLSPVLRWPLSHTQCRSQNLSRFLVLVQQQMTINSFPCSAQEGFPALASGLDRTCVPLPLRKGGPFPPSPPTPVVNLFLLKGQEHGRVFIASFALTHNQVLHWCNAESSLFFCPAPNLACVPSVKPHGQLWVRRHLLGLGFQEFSTVLLSSDFALKNSL